MTVAHGYGRHPDPRLPEALALHPMRAHRNLSAVVRRAPILWPYSFPPLDQGQTGTCVGHAWKHWELTLPVDVGTPASSPTAIEWYTRSRVLDPTVPRAQVGDLQAGSTTRYGAEAAVSFQRLAHYDWAATMADVLDYLFGVDAQGHHVGGPLVVGTNFYDSMEVPDAEGFLRITRGATIAGGHEYLLLGGNPRPRGGYVVMLNSWGSGWGDSGRARMTHALLRRLLFKENGDCVAGSELPVPVG